MFWSSIPYHACELYIGRYKIASIFTSDKRKYENLMSKMDIPFEEKIKTVWDNISLETPGRRSSISIAGKAIYDIVEELKVHGLYFAERREQ